MSGMAEVIARVLDKWPEHKTVQELAAALTAAGFRDVAEAKAAALEEAADELARLPYVKPDGDNRAEYERVLAIRRGDTDKWLRARARARAAAVRGAG
ncbi:hypothetical protein QFZ79_002912 [Arthrobacter sp. V4I6]|uniref:hypothetical protein n=1 Tax=Arthrobacter sp. V4I6 TaxID=3042281 RepID=UPI002783A4EF|nr:hypothetical protein [Arthrobacter sp. V4I6]MDQ0854801.1 hypothetical protein [Arthrobacter sp. V4I6]